MPIEFPSAFSVSHFDGRKLLAIMAILAVVLTVESQIGTIADFIPEQLDSSQGIASVHWNLGYCHGNADTRTEINPSVCNIAAVKCLSLKQPYAELLVSGMKTIEVRKWNTKFRGQFLVHASKNIDEEACKRLKIDQAKLVTGAIVGEANLYNVISYRTKNSFLNDKNKHFASSNYDNPKYGFLVNQLKGGLSSTVLIPLK